MRRLYFIYTVLISFFIIQSIFFLNNNKGEVYNKPNVENVEENKDTKEITSVFYELKRFNEIDIKKIDKRDSNVIADINIEGDKKQIENILNNINKYSILNYNFMYENGIFNINISLE